MVKQSHYSHSISEHIVSGLVSHKLLKRVARLVPLVERELLTLPGHMVHPQFLILLLPLCRASNKLSNEKKIQKPSCQ
jgi:hypothetical protein